MDIKRALEIEGMALLKCEPPTPPPPPTPQKKGIFLKVLSNFLNFQIFFKKNISHHGSNIRTHFLSRIGPSCFSSVMAVDFASLLFFHEGYQWNSLHRKWSSSCICSNKFFSHYLWFHKQWLISNNDTDSNPVCHWNLKSITVHNFSKYISISHIWLFIKLISYVYLSRFYIPSKWKKLTHLQFSNILATLNKTEFASIL